MTADDKIEALGAARVRAVPAQGPGHRRADVLVGALLLPQHREGGAAADRLLPGAGASTTWARSRTSGSGRSRCGCRKSRWRRTWTTRRACCCRPSASTSRPSRWATRSGRRRPATRSGRCTRSSTTRSSTRRFRPSCWATANQEKREVYYEELRKKIRILLEKSLRTHEQNLLMLERLGVQNEWRDKSKLAFAKLQKMLDPSFKFDFADPATAGSQSPAPPPPPTPAAAGRAAGQPGRGREPSRTRSEADRAARDRPRAPDSVARRTAADPAG